MKLNNYMQTLTERDYKKILICLTLYLTSLFAANTLGMKLMPFIFGTNLSVGVFFLFYSLISTSMPWAEKGLWVKDSYNQVFGLSARISIASLTAFFIAEYQDVIAFFFFRKKIGEKKFWLRSNLSNIWSQFLDTVIFMFVAFLGIYPFATIIAIIIPWWLYKVLMGFLYTPLSYLGIYLLKGKNANQSN